MLSWHLRVGCWLAPSAGAGTAALAFNFLALFAASLLVYWLDGKAGCVCGLGGDGVDPLLRTQAVAAAIRDSGGPVDVVRTYGVAAKENCTAAGVVLGVMILSGNNLRARNCRRCRTIWRPACGGKSTAPPAGWCRQPPWSPPTSTHDTVKTSAVVLSSFDDTASLSLAAAAAASSSTSAWLGTGSKSSREVVWGRGAPADAPCGGWLHVSSSRVIQR